MERSVSRQVGEEYARGKKMMFFETSAKTSENVAQCFEEITKMLVRKKESKRKDKERKGGVELVNADGKKEGDGNNRCC